MKNTVSITPDTDMNNKYLKTAALAAITTTLTACGGGGSEEGYGKRPETFTGVYRGQIPLVENTCPGVAADKQVSAYYFVDQAGENIVLNDARVDYTGAVFPSGDGFQASANLSGGYSVQYAFTYSGAGSKFNFTQLVFSQKERCSSRFSGTVVYDTY
jgi:hypothetical protein